MTFAPASLLALRDLWVANGGEDLGIVGDAAHAATGGYHEGRDDLQRAGVLATDYSVKQPRDVAGLSNAASAIDFGPLHGSLDELRAFSRWMVAQCQAHALGWEDVREIIYSPDGVYVMRWSGVDGLLHTSLRRNADGSITVVEPTNGDASHYSHTHVSYFRDSESRDKLALVAPFFAPKAPVVPVTIADLTGSTVTLRAGSNIRWSPEVRPDNLNVAGIAQDTVWTLGQLVRGGVDPDTGRDDWFYVAGVGYSAAGNAVGGITPPPAPEPVPSPPPLPPSPAPAPEPAPVPLPDPVPEPTPAPTPAPDPAPEPTPEPLPVPEPPAPGPEPVPTPEPVPPVVEEPPVVEPPKPTPPGLAKPKFPRGKAAAALVAGILAGFASGFRRKD